MNIVKDQVKIVVATTNFSKIEGISKAFERQYGVPSVTSFEVVTGVPEQPVNNEVKQGAENRLKYAEEKAKTDNLKYDYVVACEGGLIKQFGQWFNVQFVIVKNKDGNIGYGLSQGCQIPEKYAKEIIRSDFAKVMHRIFGKNGGMKRLSKGLTSRAKLVESATIMAIVDLNWI